MAGITTALFIMVPLLLEPQLAILRDARDEICGGNVDFVATMNEFGIVVAGYPPQMSRDYSSTYAYRAMEQLVRQPGAVNDKFMWTEGPSGSLSEVSIGTDGSDFSVEEQGGMHVEELSKLWNSQCRDISEVPFMNEILADSINSHSREATCQQAELHCNSDSPAGAKSRQICPITCQCNQPNSELVMTHPRSGCPVPCKDHPALVRFLATIKCKDQERGSQDFQSYIRGLEALKESYPVSWKPGITEIQDALRELGCLAAREPILIVGLTLDLCDEDNIWRIKPLTFVCPVACNCTSMSNPFLNLRYGAYLCPSTLTLSVSCIWLDA